MLDLLIALLYGILQGITEWLPVSSTGHMLLLEQLVPFPFSGEFREFFLVAVQLGSLAAVPAHFADRMNPRRPENRRLWGRVLAAVLPAGIAGFFLDDLLERVLYRPRVIAAALIVYGILFLFPLRPARIRDTDSISLGRAVGIGCFQALALVPGTSRSGATILGASLLGLDRSSAAEFSFFLALPTMLAAASLKGLNFALALGQGNISVSLESWLILLVAAVAAYAVSRIAIRFLLDTVRRHGFAPFGIYRILLGTAVIMFFRVK